MEFPVTAIAYVATQQGDIIVQEEVLNDELDHQNFINRYGHKNQIKYQKINKKESGSILNKAPKSLFNTEREKEEFAIRVLDLLAIKDLFPHRSDFVFSNLILKLDAETLDRAVEVQEIAERILIEDGLAERVHKTYMIRLTAEGRKMAKDMSYSSYVNRKGITEYNENFLTIAESERNKPYVTGAKNYHNIGFVVHGHNELRKFEVARFIQNDLRIDAIILHEMPNKGKTVIEKFEENSIVDFAVAIWTADDEGKSKKENDFHDRARQNVVFETAFFIGKLGREKVIVLYEDGVELPSDYKGIVYIPLSGNWKDDLRKEIIEIYKL